MAQTAAIADVTRLQVFAGPLGAMSDWARVTGSGFTEADWREVDTDTLRAASPATGC